MSISKLYFIHCDICGVSNSADMSATTAKEIKDNAKLEGWKVGKKHICPDCQEESE